VGNLVYLMASRPSHDDPSLGFAMSYSEIVRVLFELTRDGHVKAPLVLQPSDLTHRIAMSRTGPADAGATDPSLRPESDSGNSGGTRFVPRPETGDNPADSSINE
jgi:hypothetical protein